MALPAVLVDDNPEFCKNLISALADVADVEVIATAGTPEQGIATLSVHAKTWRLAVIDVFLKGGNGLQVLRSSSLRRSDQRMVLLTNYATPEIRRKAIECGADAVFDKSTEIEQFLGWCRQYATEDSSDNPLGPRPQKNEDAALDRVQPSSVDELLERVAVDRLLTDAVIGFVARNAAEVRDHLATRGSPRPLHPPAPAQPQDAPKGEGDSTPNNARDGD